MAVQQGGFKPGGGFNKPGGGGGFNKPGGFNKGGFRGRFVPRKEAEHRINHFIKVPQVRLVGENVEVGVYNTQDALRMAQEQQLDLVEISPTADPPVCKIIDYNKFLYDKKKKEKEMKAKSKTAEVKEIRFTPNTDDHDFDFKAKPADTFFKLCGKTKGVWNVEKHAENGRPSYAGNVCSEKSEEEAVTFLSFLIKV